MHAENMPAVVYQPCKRKHFCVLYEQNKHVRIYV